MAKITEDKNELANIISEKLPMAKVTTDGDFVRVEAFAPYQMELTIDEDGCTMHIEGDYETNSQEKLNIILKSIGELLSLN